jgi:preprotein translocase SecE subunit
MSAGNENSDITKSQESLIVGDESGGASGVKEDNVEAQTIDPDHAAKPQTNGGGKGPAGPRGGGGGGGGGGKPGGSGGGKPSSEADSIELFTNWAEFFQFIKDTYIEFRKISWPSRKQVLQETWSVIVLVSLLTGLVLCFDWGVAKVVFEPLDKFAKRSGGGVGNTMQHWAAPTSPEPGAPTNQPGAPANQPATPQSSPAGKLNTAPSSTPIPVTLPAQQSSSPDASTKAPAASDSKANPSSSSAAPSSKAEDAKPGESK